MAYCNTTQQIDGSQCIGDSRIVINDNFYNLDQNICNLYTLVQQLSSNMYNPPYARIEEVVSASSTTMGVPPFEVKRPLTSIRTSFGFTPTLNSESVVLPAGTYRFLWSGGVLNAGDYINIHTMRTALKTGSVTLAESPSELMTTIINGDNAQPQSFGGVFVLSTSDTISVWTKVSSYFYSWNSRNGTVTKASPGGTTPTCHSTLELWKLA